MTHEAFPIGAEPRVVLAQVNGDVRVRVWDDPAIMVATDARPRELSSEDATFRLAGCDDDLDLRVPAGSTISVSELNGDIQIEGVRRVELADVRGSVHLKQIEETVEVSALASDLEVVQTPTLLVRGHIGGEATLATITRAEIEAVADDLTIKRAEMLVVGAVEGDLEIDQLTGALRCGSVRGDCEIQADGQVELTINTIGGDLEVDGAGRVHVSSTGGDCDLSAIGADVQVVHIGGDASFIDIGQDLQVGDVAGDVEVKAVHGNMKLGSIGGNLELHTDFSPNSRAGLNVTGNATVILPDTPDLNIQATVKGQIRGHNVSAYHDGNLVRLVYGAGTAQLELTVGGNLELRASTSPRSSSVSDVWSSFEQELGSFGREMGKFGQDLSRELSALFGWNEQEQTGPANQSAGSTWSARARRKAARRARRMRHQAEERARRVQQQAEEYAQRQAHERAARMRVRFNDREWWLDPERLDRIKEQAQRAAVDGLSDALEAVERAIGKLHVPPSPASPEQPADTAPPRRDPSAAPGTPATGPTVKLHPEAAPQSPATTDTTEPGPATSDTTPPNLQQERKAILQMVAEGRISPDEGDLLLEALES